MVSAKGDWHTPMFFFRCLWILCDIPTAVAENYWKEYFRHIKFHRVESQLVTYCHLCLSVHTHIWKSLALFMKKKKNCWHNLSVVAQLKYSKKMTKRARSTLSSDLTSFTYLLFSIYAYMDEKHIRYLMLSISISLRFSFNFYLHFTLLCCQSRIFYPPSHLELYG